MKHTQKTTSTQMAMTALMMMMVMMMIMMMAQRGRRRGRRGRRRGRREGRAASTADRGPSILPAHPAKAASSTRKRKPRKQLGATCVGQHPHKGGR
jgi:hypothetical protein